MIKRNGVLSFFNFLTMLKNSVLYSKNQIISSAEIKTSNTKKFYRFNIIFLF